MLSVAVERLAGLELPLRNDAASMRTRRSARSMHSIRKDPKEDKGRIPHPSHRHASPSAPWPWVDLEDEVDPEQLECPLPPIPELCDHKSCASEGKLGCWTGYPQSRFPNWTHRQVVKSRIYAALTEYAKDDGFFTNPGPLIAEPGGEREVWDQLINEERPKDTRVRAMFIENMSGPVLQMLGAKYNIEPFFWSSSLSWIPSRFQEEIQPGVGDHITITLTFLRSMTNHDAIQLSAAFTKSTDSLTGMGAPSTLLGKQMIDPHSPLALYSNNRLLVLDLLAVHLIRNINGSTIISFHPSLDLPTTKADFLHERIRFAGQSVYWQSIFQKSPDPTFVLLTFVWHAMYAWDEALENLYEHICSLETRVIETSEMPLTRELHIIRAHHLHYTSLLDDFGKHITFIRETHNPALDHLSAEEKQFSKRIMERECANLLTESKRLKAELYMQERRLKNVMGLVFSSVNISDSKLMREMTEAAVRDSAAMKQIAYLTMVFLPASFVAAIFGMNVAEINPGSEGTLPHYFAVALPLTIVTAWVIIAFQSKYIFEDKTNFLKRLGWPAYLVLQMIRKKAQKKEGSIEVISEQNSFSSTEIKREYLRGHSD
ncbi:hypothetical protein M413DRAFT_445584 [Hebeloma cylindrosporum]|uniref:Uncharacterized protein n=1 Tax=Hebeloma cylindrosporum TaxID=76867 RepID=A0A0C3CBM5_HEBCY|nr:hypothetical protein M413DRAFT_445584 [Hebeloma cylindrosporum h7]